jgi:hypothetical protein
MRARERERKGGREGEGEEMGEVEDGGWGMDVERWRIEGEGEEGREGERQPSLILRSPKMSSRTGAEGV